MPGTHARAVYQNAVLEGMRRQLTRLDRRPWSPTYGCFDREYWNYKTLIDFPRLVFQQSALSLALLYSSPFEGNEFGENPKALEWVRAAILYWCRERNAEGSVNEWFPNERSFCATAFTAFGIAEAFLAVEKALDAESAKEIRAALSKTGHWLSQHSNPLISNQMAASTAALRAIAEATRDSKLRKTFEARKKELLSMQNAEGWFVEYGGADIGYSLLTLDLLSHVQAKSAADGELDQAINRLVDFLVFFVHPDGVMGGEYCSRSTLHSFSYGLELQASRGNAKAAWALSVVRPNLGHLPGPLTVDDTYSAYFYLHSFTLAMFAAKPLVAEPARPFEHRNHIFAAAGLAVRENKRYYAVVSLTKGGVWRAVGKSGVSCGDSGYFAVTSGGERLCSQKSALPGKLGHDHLELNARFIKVDVSLPLQRHAVGFRLFTRSILRSPQLAHFFTQTLKKRKILQAAEAPLALTRRFHFHADAIEIEDTLTLEQRLKISKLYACAEGTVFHSPSSQLFERGALSKPDLQAPGSELDLTLRAGQPVKRNRRISF